MRKVVYNRFVRGDFLAAILIRDIALAPGSGTQTIWNNIVTSIPTAENLVRSPQANVTLYLKSILQGTNTPEVTGIVRSNDDAFSITTAPSQVTVEVDIEKDSHYAIEAISMETNRNYPIVPARAAKCGKHIHAA